MSQQELLRKVIETLDRSGIDHMITGSVASSLQGEPRSTHDIDVVVAIQEIDIKGLVEAFAPPQYYLDAEAIREAISHGSMFNLIDALRVFEVQHGTLDLSYLNEWAGTLAVEDLWNRLQDEAEIV